MSESNRTKTETEAFIHAITVSLPATEKCFKELKEETRIDEIYNCILKYKKNGSAPKTYVSVKPY